MELLRFRLNGHATDRIGLHRAGIVHDVTSRFATIGDFVSECADGWSADTLDLQGLATHRIADITLAPPVDPARTVYLVGANYKQHAAEAGLSVPHTPVSV